MGGKIPPLSLQEEKEYSKKITKQECHLCLMRLVIGKTKNSKHATYWQ